jgi:hypothetical protein
MMSDHDIGAPEEEWVNHTVKRRIRPEGEMGLSDYHFITRWRVPARIEEVCDILSDPLDLPRWWPAVYLEAVEIEVQDGAAGPSPAAPEGPAAATSSGMPTADPGTPAFALLTKGWLPYTLRWSFRVVESDPPHGFALEAWGDFVGRGVWTFRQEGEIADIVYDWRITATKPLLRLGAPLFRPFFAANHRWAMRTGEESLRLELARRAASSGAEQAAGSRARLPEERADRRPYIRMIGLDEATGMLRTQLEAAVKRAGRIWNIVGIMSQNPSALKSSIDFYGTLMFGPSPLTRSRREMLAVVTSKVNHCVY